MAGFPAARRAAKPSIRRGDCAIDGAPGIVAAMKYRHFRAAVYATASDITRCRDVTRFASDLTALERHLDIAKVYLETYRSEERPDEKLLVEIRDYLRSRGIMACGGITATQRRTGREGFRWGLFCYSRKADRELLAAEVRRAAMLFDEIILDDFFFTVCTCDSCQAAKGDSGWAEFRLRMLAEVSRDCVIAPARQANPNARLVIKYPNWYPSYQDNGYNVEEQTRLFDGIYTGTETRDPAYTQQNTQSYLSYFLLRYMENVGKGKNGGGWFDCIDCFNPFTYIEQANLTLFAKAREVTLFSFGLLKDSLFPPAAGYAFEHADRILGDLGNPVGVACYMPFHSSGENHLLDYIGMLGIPLEPSPEFPAESPVVLLSARAANDPGLIDKMKGHLGRGKTLMITSGLLKRLGGRGIEEFGTLAGTDRKIRAGRFAVIPRDCSFTDYHDAGEPIQLPVVTYSTNQSWPVVSCISGELGAPLLLSHRFDSGLIYLLSIPDDYSQLYLLPQAVLRQIREALTPHLPVVIDAKARVGLFAYDNDTFIVESFLPYPTEVDIIARAAGSRLQDLLGASPPAGMSDREGKPIFRIQLKPGTYRAFRIVR